MDDFELVRRAREGDRYAFNLLVWRWERPIYNLALRYLGSEEDATEVCQEVFVRAYTHLKEFRGEAQFSTWLYRIAVNCCHNIVRRRKRNREVSLDTIRALGTAKITQPETGQAEEEYQRAQLLTRVAEALQMLPEEQRIVVELRILHDRPVEEVSEILGIPPGTVKSRLFYALRKLRDYLKDILHAEFEGELHDKAGSSKMEERPV